MEESAQRFPGYRIVNAFLLRGTDECSDAGSINTLSGGPDTFETHITIESNCGGLTSYPRKIFDTLSEGKRLDTVYLDLAKAFDNVDHEILIEKVKSIKLVERLESG